MFTRRPLRDRESFDSQSLSIGLPRRGTPVSPTRNELILDLSEGVWDLWYVVVAMATPQSQPKKAGRPHKIGPKELGVLREIALAKPGSTIGELVTAFTTATGIDVDRWMLSKSLRRAGVVRMKRKRSPPPTKPKTDPHRFTDDNRPRGRRTVTRRV